MFRDLGRVHIVSFAVGIVGLIIGITGIVLAIVFGTSQPTCSTPVPPTPCPQQANLPACNTNLFAISTTINTIPWDPDFNTDPTKYNAAVDTITNLLTTSLNSGLNNQTSSSFFRILAATGPTSNNVKVQITKLQQGTNGLTVAIGNGAISSAVVDNNAMPNATTVQTVINDQNNTYSGATTAQQACNSTIVCDVCTTPAPFQCSTLPVQTTNTPLPTNPPSSSSAPVTTATQPVSTTTATQPVQTSTQPATTATQPETAATSQKLTSATVVDTSPQVTTQTTPGQTSASQTTSGGQTVVTTVTTPGAQSTATVPVTTTTQAAPITSTQGIKTTNTPTASSLSTAPPLTTRTTQGSSTPGISSTVLLTSTSTNGVPSTSPTIPTIQVTSTSVNPSTSTKSPSISTSSPQPIPTSTQSVITSTFLVTSTQPVPSSSQNPTTVPTTSETTPTPPGSSSTSASQTQTPNNSTSTIPVTSTTASATTTFSVTSTSGAQSSSPTVPPTTTPNLTTSRSASMSTSQTQPINPSTSTIPVTTSTAPGISTRPLTSTQGVPSSSPTTPSTTQQVSTPRGSTITIPIVTTQTPSPSPSSSSPSILPTSTVPVTSSIAPGTSTAPPTIGPDQCYYQSNVAVAFELTGNPTINPIDYEIETFIMNTLIFYPGNPYKLGDAESSMTKLALVPYPTSPNAAEYMNYGNVTGQAGIGIFFNVFEAFVGQDAQINQSLDFISNLAYTGSPGFVIIIGNNGTSITSSAASSKTLQQHGFSVITIGYNSTADFSSLASDPGYSFTISQISDELSVAQKIGNILNTTYCLSTTASPTTPGTTASIITTATTVGAQSTSVPTSAATSIATSTATPAATSASSLAATSTQAPVTSTIPTVQASTSLPVTSTKPPTPQTSTIITSTTRMASSSVPVQSTSTPQVTTPSSPGTSTPRPTLAPGQCYYQSNVAVAFELTSSTSNVDLEIQSFIENDLFFYSGAPYQFGTPTEGKTELSLVPFPNADILVDLMRYGASQTSGQIKASMDVFQMLAQEPATISDAFDVIPKNERQGPPGFVILIAYTDTTVQASVNSANNLKNLGFKIITVAYKSAGSFVTLSSDPSYNFQIHQDSDQNSVAMAIGNILNTTFCTSTGSTTIGSTPVVQTSTVTVPQAQTSTSSPASTVTIPSTASQSSSPIPISTVTVPSTSYTSPSSMSQSSSTASYTSTTGPTYSTAPTAGSTSGPSQQSTSSPAQQSTTQGGSSSTVQQSTTVMGSSSSPSQQSTSLGSSSSSSQQSSTPGVSTSSPAQQSTSPGGSTSSPSQQSTSMGSSSSQSPQSSTQSISSSSYATSSGSTASTPGSSSSMTPQSPTSYASSSTVTVPSTVPTSSGTPAPTTSQKCPNQQTVFNGKIGVIYEMLPASAQQNTINDFVENILLNSNFYGLAVDNLTNQNRTLVTAIPYPSTSQYGVLGYGSARSVSDFKNQVIAFNTAIKPITASSDISDALTYVTTNLPAGGVKSSLIIVGNSAAMIDATAPILAGNLQSNFDIYTVSVGTNAVDLSPLSSGAGYSFTGNTQDIANQIGMKMSASNPADYCPPPVPSTSAPSTSTVTFSSTVPVTTPVASTTSFTTVRPTVGPCQCTGRWVYNGDLAIAFEYIKTSDGSQNVTNFIANTLLSNPDSYGLSSDVKGNQASQLTIVPYPDTSDYPIYPYGSIHYPSDIGNFVDAYSGIQSTSKDPSISSALDYITTNLKNTSDTRVVLLIASDGSDVNAAMQTATDMKNAGYTVITVAQTAAATVFQPLSSGSQFIFHIGDGNDNDVANKIANLLLDISFTCFDDGSSTPSPITRCPGTQGTTQPGVTGTSTSSAPVASSSTVASTVPVGSSSSIANTGSSTVAIQTTQGASTAALSGSSSTIGSSSTVQQGSSSTVGGSSSTAVNTQSTVSGVGSSTVALASSSTMGSTVPVVSSTVASSSIGSTVGSASPSIGSTVSSASSSIGSTVSSASSSIGSTVSSASSSIGSTVSSASSSIGSTVSSASSSIGSTVSSASSSIGSTVSSASSSIGSTVSSASSSIGSTVSSASSSIGSTVSSASSSIGSTVSSASSSIGSTVSSASSSIGSTVSSASSTMGSSTVANTASTTVASSSSTVVNTASTTVGSTVTQGSSTVNTGSTVTASGSSTTQSSVSSSSISTDSTTAGSTVTTIQRSSSSMASTAVNTGSTTVGSTVTQGSSTGSNTGSTTASVQSSTAGSTDGSTQSVISSTSVVPLCTNPFSGKIATVFELNAVQPEIQNVTTFVSSNLYNSANYNFASVTQAINIPYGDIDNQDNQAILQYGNAKSLTDLQNNIATLASNSMLSPSSEVSDGLQWLIDNRDPDGTSGVIIVVGVHDDSNYGLTVGNLLTLRNQGWKVITVYLGTNGFYFGQIADKPEWYFQVNDSNGQSVANQISTILCNL